MSETPKRTLLDIFNKYNPGPETKELLLSARDYRMRIDRELKRKLEEFGRLKDGQLTEPFIVPDINTVKEWLE